MMKKEGILNILEKSVGYETALLTTFNYEIDFFEKAVLSRLIRNEIRNISVFVDSDELAKAVREVHACTLGQNYAVNPVRIYGAFHPKVILLLGDSKARLIVSSANIKLSGYCINNEIFNYIDYDPQHRQYRDVIYSAICFFEAAYEWTPRLDNTLLRGLDKYPYFRASKGNGRITFLENSKRSMLEQLNEAITEEITDIRIAVPYYDNELAALSSIKSSFPSARIHLYLQLERSTFPESVQIRNSIADDFHIFNKVKAPGNDNAHFYHGKVFEFISAGNAYIFYGSSNCTLSALLRPAEDSGNCECNLLIKGFCDDFDDFFNCFEIIDADSPKSHRMIFENKEKTRFFFKYGELSKNLRLHIGFRKLPAHLRFIYNSAEVTWKIQDGEILVEISQDNYSTIFDLIVQFDGGEETVRCWYNDTAALEINRIKVSDAGEIKDIDSFGLGEKYREDYEKILRAIAINAPELIEQNRVKSLSGAQVQENEESDLMVDDDNFVINQTLSDEDYKAARQFHVVEQLRGRIFSRYVHSSSLLFSYRPHRQKPVDKEFSQSDDTERKRRPATSEEMRFSRFAKRRIRDMQDEENFVSVVTAEHYAGTVFIVFEILDKFCLKEKIDGVFSLDYMIKTRFALMTLLLKKLDPAGLDTKSIIAKFLDIMFNNHELFERMDSQEQRVAFEKDNQNLLQAIDKKFHIRSRYKEYVDCLSGGSTMEDRQLRQKEALVYFENLFGYKDITSLTEYLYKCYGPDTRVQISGPTASIIVNVPKPSNYLKPDQAILRELYRYSLNVSRLTSVYLIYLNSGSYKKNEIARIEHTISLNQRKDRYKIIRGSGSSEEYGPNFISF